MKNDYEDILETWFRAAIDNVIDEFMENPNSIFRNSSERDRIFFPNATKHFKDWKQSKRCIFKGCNNFSIPKSHSISKSAFLSTIAEKSHLYTPEIEMKSGKIVVRKIGINEASTFPGFCEFHERMFQDFERRGTLVDDNDLWLQVYRTVCREVVIKEHWIDTLTAFHRVYIEHRNKSLLDKLRQEPFMQLLEKDGARWQSFQYKGYDNLSNTLQAQIKKLKMENASFKHLFYDRIHKEFKSHNSRPRFGGVKIIVNEQIPVAISGRGSFDIYDSNKNEERNIQVVINVIPNNSSSLICIFSLKRDEDAVKMYANNFLRHDFGLINMVEAWMVYGSDHWFLKPSVWDAITSENQQFIINELQNFKVSMATNITKTIFNTLKRNNLASFKTTHNSIDYHIFLRNEESKFTDK